jgi:hypothetical protein
MQQFDQNLKSIPELLRKRNMLKPPVPGRQKRSSMGVQSQLLTLDQKEVNQIHKNRD